MLKIVQIGEEFVLVISMRTYIDLLPVAVRREGHHLLPRLRLT